MRYPSHIYVMSDGAGLVKIGLSRQLDRRAKVISAEGRPVTLEWATPLHADPLTIEMTAHTLLVQQHVSREWFRASVADAISAVATAVGMIAQGDRSKRRRPPCNRRPSTRVRKTGFVAIRLSQVERSALTAAAKFHQRPLSEMARKIILDHLQLQGKPNV